MTQHETKAEQRTKLYVKFGQLLAGLREMAVRPSPPTSAEYRIAQAKFRPDQGDWQQHARTFAKIGDYTFDRESHDIIYPVAEVCEVLGEIARSTFDDYRKQQTLKQNLDNYERQTLTAIDAVPIEWEAKLSAERTPFSTSLAIKDAMRTGKRRMDYFDRYINSDFFELYVRDLRRDIEIRLVTTPGDARYGVQSITALSRLAAQEFASFQLFQCQPAALHDRNLRIDNQIFALGSGASNVQNYPTNFTPSDSSPPAHKILDDLIANCAKIV
jgi:hypothetical protein